MFDVGLKSHQMQHLYASIIFLGVLACPTCPTLWETNWSESLTDAVDASPTPRKLSYINF